MISIVKRKRRFPLTSQIGLYTSGQAWQSDILPKTGTDLFFDHIVNNKQSWGSNLYS